MAQVRKVLHVEDDRVSAMLVARMLERHDFEVVTVADPRLALETLKAQGMRVVLLDIQMPHIDGVELLTILKREDAGLQVIMLTGVTTQASVVDSKCAGAFDCIFKPVIDPAELVDAVRRAYDSEDRWILRLQQLLTRRQTQAA